MKRIIAAFLCAGSLLVLCSCGGIAGTYEKAQDALAKGEYQSAAELFESISAYEDSSKLALYARALLYGEEKDYEKAVDALVFLGDYKDSVQLISYYSVCRLSESDDTFDILLAAQQFDAMAAYRDSATRADQCRQTVYDEAVSQLNRGDYDSAQRIFVGLGTYKDSPEQALNCDKAEDEKEKTDEYLYAEQLLNNGQYGEAIRIYSLLGEYRDSIEKVEEIKRFLFSIAQAGSTLYFGRYEQDNNTANGKEIIEWLVLFRENNRVLVISRYALDSQQYNTNKENVAWKTCSLRKWLNESFIDTAFSEEEKALIPAVIISEDQNMDYSTDPGNNTTDQVFLLSIMEANRYFTSDRDRQCQSALESLSPGVNHSNSGNCWWWLRSLGSYSGTAADVTADGSIDVYGNYADDSRAVRPAMWIEFGS